MRESERECERVRESEREREREREKERERERRTDGRKKGRDSKKKKVLEQNDKWKGKKNNKHQHDRKPRNHDGKPRRESVSISQRTRTRTKSEQPNKKNTHCLFVRLFDFAPVPRALVSLRCKLPHRPDVGERLLCHRRGL